MKYTVTGQYDATVLADELTTAFGTAYGLSTAGTELTLYDVPDEAAVVAIIEAHAANYESSQAAKQDAERIAKLWQAAHDYEYAEISGSAVGLLSLGVIQGKPKAIAVQNWIHGIWTEYYTRKAGTSTDTDYSMCGACPYTVPELMAELGL